MTDGTLSIKRMRRRRQSIFEKTCGTEITKSNISPLMLSSGDVVSPKRQAQFSFLLKSNAELTIPDELTDVRDIVREWTTTRGVLLLTPVFVLPVGATLKFDDSF